MKNKKIIARQTDFAAWYTSVIKEAKLVEYAPVKGTMFFLPNGWAIWELIKQEVDKHFAKMGVRNVQLPLLIKESDFLKEKQHVEGFAPELFVVTTNKKMDDSERLIIRPTSEIPFSQCFKSQLGSYNDLPFLYNQWCSVCRVEKNTRPFLRNTEFHWQELHTIHASAKEAMSQTLRSLEAYKKVLQDFLCIPFIVGEKTANERFAGAENTFTLESLMQDGQALQCATSHYLGQNFAKAYDLKFQNRDNKFEYVYQTSAGISTRIIGGLIMSHSDDSGLILPFKVAPTQIAIISVNGNDKATTSYIKKVKKALGNKYRIAIDNSDKSFGFKINKHQTEGVPFCLIIGSQEIEANVVTFIARDSDEKVKVPVKNLSKYLTNAIKTFQANLYNNAKNRLNSSIVEVNNFEQFKDAINAKKIALAYFDDTVANEKKIKELTGATARCIKLSGVTGKTCFFTGKPATHQIYFARAY